MFLNCTLLQRKPLQRCRELTNLGDYRMSEENYVYLKVKLSLKPGQSESSIQEIVQELDYSFNHEEIVFTEITDIHDIQVSQ